MSTPQKSSAAAVSAVLAREGMRPLPSGTSRMREGLRVSRGLGDIAARISADFDSDRTAERRMDDVMCILAAAGYDVERVSPTQVSVKKSCV